MASRCMTPLTWKLLCASRFHWLRWTANCGLLRRAREWSCWGCDRLPTSRRRSEKEGSQPPYGLIGNEIAFEPSAPHWFEFVASTVPLATVWFALAGLYTKDHRCVRLCEVCRPDCGGKLLT